MADIKISELTAVSSLNNGDLVEVSQVNALAPSGYTSLKASMTDLGKKVNSDIEYTTELADFTDKTPLGAIKETAKDKNVADEYDGTQTYDKGDVVIYKNTLYICTTNNTTGAWDATKWTATTVQSLIGDLSTLTTSDKSSIVGAVNEAYINPNELTITSQNVNLSTNNSKIYRLTNKMIVVYFDFVFSSVSSGWNDLFEFNCSTSFAVAPFAAVASSSGTVSAYTQAYYDNGKIKIREQGCNASNTFRGQMIILIV